MGCVLPRFLYSKYDINTLDFSPDYKNTNLHYRKINKKNYSGYDEYFLDFV